ncbi:hypothetical protein M407DRAFT_34769 [Tulasnella calospora MUT 4182]|uniref:Protein kinase domain-containing protein n=1 Tax=Tulasnella calospora MUT 4182 TaxID=1051891 RepID=A0A0C3PMR1_9AGAM|nr:hypothetical protein M407DRAFT_34769 [Tulasnella calospora MUT 4182]
MNGLQYLHDREPPVVQGNITPFNVLITETGQAVLSDVGLAAIDWHPIATSPRASVRWSSPEVNLGDSAAVQSDIWSWACVVLQLVTRHPPYSYLQNEDQIKELMSLRRDQLTPDAFHKLDDVPADLVPTTSTIPKIRALLSSQGSKTLTLAHQAHSGTEEQASILSSSDDITHFITSVSPQAICINGRFGDVFKGNHKTVGEVALKRLRIGGAAVDEQVIRIHGVVWNIPMSSNFSARTSPRHIFTLFMRNGTLLEYVEKVPSVNRVRLVYETSDAVGYLHREDIVHGDIKAGNLLISADGHVLLCDFGLTKSTYAQTSTALKGAGTLRWQSPELWNNEPRTFASDVYAFSMTIVEVFTSLPPFSHLENGVAVMMAVYQRDERPGKSPLELNGVSYENAWQVAEACWPKIPEARISISEAFHLLKADPSLA